MKQLHEDLWVTTSPLRFVGLEIGARMTVVRLPDGKLLLHSPIAASAELIESVSSKGRVSYLIAPNLFHHLYIGQWQEAFPDAHTYLAPGLEKKRPDLPVKDILTDHAPAQWSSTLDQALLSGCPRVNEVVFFHRPSATLILADLAFNLGPTSPPLTRCAFKLAGAYATLSPTLLERLLVQDRNSFRNDLQKVLSWPFERVIVAHGEVCESSAQQQLRSGYSWVLESR